MHIYQNSIGFGNLKSHEDMDLIVRNTVLHFDEKHIFRTEKNSIYGEFTKEYGDKFGMKVCGEFTDTGNFYPEYTIPYLIGNTVSMVQETDFERHAGREAYAGVAEDPRIGATIIFYMINMGEMQDRKATGALPQEPIKVYLSGLAREGEILLPVKKTAHDEEVYQQHREEYFRLLNDAQNGDESAMEALSTEEMTDYNIVTRRLQNEDVFSIVDSCFLPYGVECDQYSICGNICSCKKIFNEATREVLYKMEVEASDLYFDVIVNENDLLGEPEVGRRFRGILWLQGYADLA